MNVRQNPCFNCERRTLGCHSICEDYLNWHKAREMMREEGTKRCKDAANQYMVFAHRQERRRKRRGEK